jgi:hypothetical protein
MYLRHPIHASLRFPNFRKLLYSTIHDVNYTVNPNPKWTIETLSNITLINQVKTTYFMKSSTLWDNMRCNPMEANLHFAGTCSSCNNSTLLPASRWFLSCIALQYSGYRLHVYFLRTARRKQNSFYNHKRENIKSYMYIEREFMYLCRSRKPRLRP